MASTNPVNEAQAPGSVQDPPHSPSKLTGMADLIIDNPMQSYPSPSSSYYPPPAMNDPEEYTRDKKRQKTDSRGPAFATQSLGDAASPGAVTARSQGSPVSGVGSPITETTEQRTSPDAGRRVSGPGEGKVFGRDRPISEPRGDNQNLTVEDTLTVSPTTPRSKRFSTPATMSLINSKPDVQTPQSLPPGSATYFDVSMLPSSKRSSLTSNRPAPPSPGASRRQSKRASKSYHFDALAQSSTPTQPTQKRYSNVVLKIIDFAYDSKDKRHKFNQKVNLNEPFRPPSPAPGGFLGPLNPNVGPFAEEWRNSRASAEGGGWGGLFSKVWGFGFLSTKSEEVTSTSKEATSSSSSGLDDPNQDDSTPMQVDKEDPMDSSLDEDFDGDTSRGESIFVPGWYRALYAFEPEGVAEMDLKEDQMVRCLGRGGGEGWLIAVREENPDGTIAHALIPASYVEFVEPFSQEEMDKAMGRLSSPT